ncbi:MAG: nucleotide pyrophosphatase [Dehalococcoidia bacterium]
MVNPYTNYIVSGLERSGTSVMMQMLIAGGMPVAFDESRPPDEHNPRGYYELAGGKIINRLMDGTIDLDSYRGKVLKVTAYGLKFLPDGKYKIIYMTRNMDEVLNSMEKMGAGIDREKDAVLFEKLNRFSFELMENRNDMEYITVNYGEVIGNPRIAIENVTGFFDIQMDIESAIEAVDSRLYRNRASS